MMLHWLKSIMPKIQHHFQKINASPYGKLTHALVEKTLVECEEIPYGFMLEMIALPNPPKSFSFGQISGSLDTLNLFEKGFITQEPSLCYDNEPNRFLRLFFSYLLRN